MHIAIVAVKPGSNAEEVDAERGSFLPLVSGFFER
jgi:hypothetical protein